MSGSAAIRYISAVISNTTNPAVLLLRGGLDSTTVRHSTTHTRNSACRLALVGLAFKLMEVAEKLWRKILGLDRMEMQVKGIPTRRRNIRANQSTRTTKAHGHEPMTPVSHHILAYLLFRS